MEINVSMSYVDDEKYQVTNASGNKLLVDMYSQDKKKNFSPMELLDVTFRLKKVFAKSILENNLNKLLYKVEQPLSFVLASMELEGVTIDDKKLQEMSKELDSMINDSEKEIFRFSGEEFNISSPKQLGMILFEK